MDQERLRETAIRAVESFRGDDLERARRLFGSSDLDQKHGNSGQTRRQILQAYEEHAALCDATIEWLRKGGEA